VHYEPLLNIALTNVIADELHLLLQITDKLLQNLIDEVLERDAVEDFNKKGEHPKGCISQSCLTASILLAFPFLFGIKKCRWLGEAS